jgi:hypothetical protein
MNVYKYTCILLYVLVYVPSMGYVYINVYINIRICIHMYIYAFTFIYICILIYSMLSLLNISVLFFRDFQTTLKEITGSDFKVFRMYMYIYK